MATVLDAVFVAMFLNTAWLTFAASLNFPLPEKLPSAIKGRRSAEDTSSPVDSPSARGVSNVASVKSLDKSRPLSALSSIVMLSPIPLSFAIAVNPLPYVLN